MNSAELEYYTKHEKVPEANRSVIRVCWWFRGRGTDDQPRWRAHGEGLTESQGELGGDQMKQDWASVSHCLGKLSFCMDFKVGKSLKYLTGVMQIFLLTLSSLESSACLDLIFTPLILLFFFDFFFYMTLSLFSPSSLAECTWLFCFPECMESHCCLATRVSLSPWIFPFFLPFLACQEEHFCLPLSPALPVCLLFWFLDSWTPTLALTPLFGAPQLGSSGSCTGGFSAVGTEHSIGKMIMVTFLWGCNLTVCTCFTTLLVTFKLFQ